MRLGFCVGVTAVALLATACDGSDEVRRPAPPNDGVYGFAQQCVTMEGARPGGSGARFLAPSNEGAAFAFSEGSEQDASRFFMKPSDLGTYLFYDAERRYLVSDGTDLFRKAELESDITTLDDTFQSGAEWTLEVSGSDPDRFRLLNLASGRYLTTSGLTDDVGAAAEITLFPATECAEFPELTTDTEGTVQTRQWDDGSVWGIVDTHSHIMSNFGFGGGGIFHGAPFHRLGVEAALPDCEMFHGVDGRKDLLGYGFDRAGGPDNLDEQVLLTSLFTKMAPEFNHHTAGYPDFTSWPSAHFSSTHQTQYYKWLERAYMAGLRLEVQLGTSNQVICDLMVGAGVQQTRYSCDDMVGIDRSIEETYNMQDYIDAQSGGPGKGWFRIVTSPEQAREVINAGKLAVVLGIEVSNLFDCFLVPPPGAPTCDEAYVTEQLDKYYAMGVRDLFPVHKYDNAFSAGDGDRGIMELANFIQTGHWLNFTQDCPAVPAVFDHGSVTFGGINMPRAVYDSPPPNDMTGFADDPIGTLLPFSDLLLNGGRLDGDYCQNAGLTPIGEYLMTEMMHRGMIIEVDHMPRRSIQRAYEILEANDYPAAGTHGNNFNGELYALGGVSKSGFGTCHDPDNPGTVDNGYQARIQLIRDNGGYPAEGFGFDLNGFAGARGPRFGPDSGCSQPQENPVTYPFSSYAGDVTFQEPRVGNRVIDFNTEGMAHIGLLPELIEDVRHDGVTDEELEPLFRSAEGYLRMWEKAERRAAEMQTP